jgi:hypothetical protein
MPQPTTACPEPVRYEGHGATKRGNIVLAIGHTIAVFEEHLMGR